MKLAFEKHRLPALDRSATYGKINDQTPVMYLLALLWVARHPYGSKAELEKYLGASQGSVSRAVRYWMNRPGGGSERFIESYEDTYDRRRRRLRLTPLGSRFVNDFIAA